MSASAIIVAGGRGTRMGSPVPKQLLMLEDKTILEHTLAPFLACASLGTIVIAVASELHEAVMRTVAGLHVPEGKVILAPGGAQRQDSVSNGLSALPGDTEIVVIHDAVRPFITPRAIEACIKAARETGAATVMRPVTETVKVVHDRRVVETLDRSMLWITQTPQAFRLPIIREAHERALREGFRGTDDAMLVERLGLPVQVVEGSDLNIKITTPADLKLAGELLPLYERECER